MIIEPKIDIEFLKNVAEEAGELALKLLKSMKAEFKADSSYVTNVDREIEIFVRGKLHEKYPEFAFLGEEFGYHGKKRSAVGVRSD